MADVDCTCPSGDGSLRWPCPQHPPGVNRWVPITDIAKLRVLGKAAEEAGELASVLARCIIQGVDECEPTTGKPNRQWLEEEIADVEANLRILIAELGLDYNGIADRRNDKILKLQQWRHLLENTP